KHVAHQGAAECEIVIAVERCGKIDALVHRSDFNLDESLQALLNVVKQCFQNGALLAIHADDLDAAGRKRVTIEHHVQLDDQSSHTINIEHGRRLRRICRQDGDLARCNVIVIGRYVEGCGGCCL